jgi:polyisoprenoid-binding protein YceI
MMKRNVLALVLASALPINAWAADYTIDPSHTYAHFSVSHLGFSTLQGRFDKSSGKATLDMAGKSGSVHLDIEANSISTGFAKRDEHLKSPDFFNAAEFPKITYKSSAIKFTGNTPSSVEGTLTMLGVSKPVTLNIDAFKCGTNPMNKKDECGAAASAQIKRSDFGIKYGLPGIGDDIKLVFEIEAYKD